MPLQNTTGKDWIAIKGFHFSSFCYEGIYASLTESKNCEFTRNITQIIIL